MQCNPIFDAVIVLSLALGIGANTALLGLIEATLVRDLAECGRTRSLNRRRRLR
jgi:hypothetical protein